MHDVSRELVDTLYQFIMAPHGDFATLRLWHAWLQRFPKLVARRDLTPRQRRLLEWTDAAAEAHIKY